MAQRFARFIKLYHLLLQRSGGYSFIRENLLKLLGSIAAILILFYAIDAFVIDIDSMTAWLARVLSTPGLLGLFFFSEISLGFITPEFLIIWADETPHKVQALAGLSALSYAAGIIAYFIGRYWSTRRVVREKFIERYKGTLDQLKKFGGLLIVLAALTPLPYPIVCQLCGLTNYPFKNFALLTLVRFLRFAIYGLVLYKLF